MLQTWEMKVWFKNCFTINKKAGDYIRLLVYVFYYSRNEMLYYSGTTTTLILL